MVGLRVAGLQWGFLHSLPNLGEVSHRPLQLFRVPGSSEHLKFLSSQLLISRVSNS